MTAARLHRLQLTNFRSYRAAKLEIARDMVVLVGPNGAGKTNLLEAISFFVPGRGLRRATLDEVAFGEGDGSWAASVEVEGALGLATLGTGIEPPHEGENATTRQCRIDREPVSSAAAFADHLRVIWLTPAMDGLFSGPPPSGGVSSTGWWSRSMPSIAAASRRSSAPALAQSAAGRPAATIRIGSTRSSTRPPSSRSRSRRCARKPSSACRASSRKAGTIDSALSLRRDRLSGWIEQMLRDHPATEIEDRYRAVLRENRARDAAAGRTLDGPHLTDLAVVYGPKNIPAADASTGEQKAVLIRLVLAHCGLLRR